jgi:signal transduction histidine kinase
MQRLNDPQGKTSRSPLYSLRAKLLLFSLLLVAVPGVVFALIAIHTAGDALLDVVGRQLAEVADDTASEVTELLGRERNKMAAWAHQDVMREIRIGDLDKRITRFLLSSKQSDASYLDLLCTDAGGRVIAASNPASLGATYAQSEWFRTAVLGNDFLAGPVPSLVDGWPALEIAAPIHDPDNYDAVIGTLLGLYDWRQGTALAQHRRERSADLRLAVDVLLLDGQGVSIAATRTEEATGAGQNLRAAGWLAAQPLPPKVRPGYVREPQFDFLVGYARLRGPAPPWTALVMQPVHQALAPVLSMERHLTLLLVGVLLVGLGVAALLAQRMGRPLRELTRATQEITRSGEPRRPVPVRSRDEIGQLAQAFNTMAAELKRARDDLVTAAKFAFVGEIAAGVAHEVRTPLGILRTSAQILGRSLPAGQSHSAELVDMIIGEVDRLDRVVAGLLEIARPRELLIEPTPLAAVVRRALDFAEVQAREKGIAIRPVLSSGERPARCDPVQIYQVVLNLIVNALQILPRGGEITVRTLPPHNGCVSLEVSDNGPGIAPDMQERIFTPFFTMREGGTGLGLALVQRIVQAHQGTVAVHSEVGRGTTFRVELPAAQET